MQDQSVERRLAAGRRRRQPSYGGRRSWHPRPAQDNTVDLSYRADSIELFCPAARTGYAFYLGIGVLSAKTIFAWRSRWFVRRHELVPLYRRSLHPLEDRGGRTRRRTFDCSDRHFCARAQLGHRRHGRADSCRHQGWRSGRAHRYGWFGRSLIRSNSHKFASRWDLGPIRLAPGLRQESCRKRDEHGGMSCSLTEVLRFQIS